MADIIAAMNYLLLKTFLVVICLLSDSALTAPLALLPKSVVAITSEGRPVRCSLYVDDLLQRHNIAFSQYNLDAVTTLEDKWSKGLPANQNAAKAFFERRLSVVGKKAFEAELISAYKGLSTAIGFHIDRYPAIIFDDQYVIYGITDLDKALKMYSVFVQTQEALYE